MKKLVYFILVSLLAFTSCKEESINSIVVDSIPSPPTLNAPADTSFNIDLPVILKWNESKGAISYTLQVSSSSSFNNNQLTRKDITTSTIEIPGLNYSSVYYWRVSASNGAGTSDWSKVWSFTTGEAAAFVPQLSKPYNGAIEQKLSLDLLWYSVSNAKKYTLQVSTNSSFTYFVLNSDTLTQSTLRLSDLNISTRYYWRVAASNQIGSMGWSETWSFTTGIPPLPPVLLSPNNKATDQLLLPTLSWNASVGAKNYFLQVSRDSAFSNLVINQWVGDVTRTLSTRLDANTKFFWRVNASNNSGTSTWSDIWSFTTNGVCEGVESVLYENRTYHTVAIGNQCWLKENLNVGTMIQSPLNMSDNGILEKYCWNNDQANCDIYGGLYQWNEAVKYRVEGGGQGICPDGWHLPTTTEFTTLAAMVGQSSNALKAIGQGTGNGAGTNISGFSVLLNPFRGYNGYFQGSGAYLWSSSKQTDVYANGLYLLNDDNYINISTNVQVYGYNIRCIKDYY